MKAVIHVNNLEHQRTHGQAMKFGLERHGILTTFAAYDSPEPCDFAVVWGSPIKHPRVSESVKRVLVMEAGHIGGRDLTRLTYVSCGWNGLGRRGRYPHIFDAGARWSKLYGDFMQPWQIREGYALVIGQVPSDAALYTLKGGFEQWAQTQCVALKHEGYAVRFRPHPIAVRNGHITYPTGAEISTRSLADDLADASLVVSYNSTVGVESVLAGVPTITMDEGAMAWDVSGHRLAERITPDRSQWAQWLAYTQWNINEITNGVAWDALRTCMEG